MRRSDYVAAVCTILALSVYRVAFMTRELSQPYTEMELYHANFMPSYLPFKHSAPRVPPTFSNLRKLDESEMPYKCGIIFFYHIACTGGASINKWLIRLHKLNNVTYFTHWGRKDGAQTGFIRKMEKQVEDFGPNEWRIVHAHGYSLMPNSSEPYLYLWREKVESQGCRFVLNTVLRDAVSHTVSQSKGLIKTNYTLDEWLSHLKPENLDQRGIWNTQLDYLVYNRGPRNQYKVSKEEKVRRAMELLQRHFDFVLYSDHDAYTRIIAKITGWDIEPMKKANIFNGEIKFTEEEFDKIRRLTIANGDVDFIDAVKHIYNNELGYLTV